LGLVDLVSNHDMQPIIAVSLSFPPLRAHLILKISFSGCSRSTWNTWNNFNLEPKYMHSIRGRSVEAAATVEAYG
jgi:hypothetical protein